MPFRNLSACQHLGCYLRVSAVGDLSQLQKLDTHLALNERNRSLGNKHEDLCTALVLLRVMPCNSCHWNKSWHRSALQTNGGIKDVQIHAKKRFIVTLFVWFWEFLVKQWLRHTEGVPCCHFDPFCDKFSFKLCSSYCSVLAIGKPSVCDGPRCSLTSNRQVFHSDTLWYSETAEMSEGLKEQMQTFLKQECFGQLVEWCSSRK